MVYGFMIFWVYITIFLVKVFYKYMRSSVNIEVKIQMIIAFLLWALYTKTISYEVIDFINSKLIYFGG